jgi:hypothetical protein
MGDLLKITPEQIQSGEFIIISKKENIAGKCYISDETKALFNQLIKSGLSLPTTQHGIDRMMTVACKTAGFEKRINQHLFRKLWITQAINLGLSEPIVKILSFKSVDKSLLTYMLDRNDLKDSWKKVIDSLPLEPKNGNGRVTNIEEALDLVMKTLRKMIEKEMGPVDRIAEVTDKEILMEYLQEKP